MIAVHSDMFHRSCTLLKTHDRKSRHICVHCNLGLGISAVIIWFPNQD